MDEHAESLGPICPEELAEILAEQGVDVSPAAAAELAKLLEAVGSLDGVLDLLDEMESPAADARAA
jgi:ribosomal protein L12E/L44/L45/RPP1/RPP2